MTKKSSLKHRSNKQHKASATKKQSPSESETSNPSKSGTLLAILSLLLTAAGLIALRPQLSVSVQEQIEHLQPFSAPFRITNTGLLSIHLKSVICYFDEIDYPATSFRFVTEHRAQWDNVTLGGGDSETIICSIRSVTPTAAKSRHGGCRRLQPFRIALLYSALFSIRRGVYR